MLAAALIACGAEEAPRTEAQPAPESAATVPEQGADARSEEGAGGAPTPTKREQDILRAMEESNYRGAWAVMRPARTPSLPPEELEQLLALGYADGTREAPEHTDVTLHDPSRAWQGSNLYVAGHAAEANLVDMSGRLLHRWKFDPSQVAKQLGVPHHSLQYWFRRAHLYPNGDLLAVVDQLMLVKLDRHSKLLWAYTGRCHHDLEVGPAGEIYVLTAERRPVPYLDPHPQRLFTDNDIVRLDADGNELDRLSIFEALERGQATEMIERLRELLPGRIGAIGDILHTNTIELLDGRLAERIPAFRRGNLLLSFPHIHALMVVDMEKRAVVWTMTGQFRYQHHPTVLDNGNLLVFDNQRGPDERSAVYELDPVSGAEGWAYRGSAEDPFYTWCCGTTHRLPNGNTLIVETEGGRAFEVTPAGETVWEFVNPQRAGKHKDLIAQLFELVRLGPDFPLDWIPKTPPEG